MVDFAKIKELREEINKLLEEHPELRPLQEEIDSELSKCGNDTQRRNAKIQEMMMNTWYKIVPTWNEFAESKENNKLTVVEEE